MAANVIVKASSIITMDESNPRAEAIAIDTSTGKIVAVGSLTDCQAAAPGAVLTDLGSTVLMPGFIEAHSHPFLSRVGGYWTPNTSRTNCHVDRCGFGRRRSHNCRGLFDNLGNEYQHS